MYQVKIQIVSLKVLQCLVDGFLHVVRVVVCVPQLAGDLEVEISHCSRNEYWEDFTYEDLLTRNTGLLPAIAYFVLILITRSCVNVTITLAKGSFDSILHFVRLGELDKMYLAIR
jgi:hypothetical protein